MNIVQICIYVGVQICIYVWWGSKVLENVLSVPLSFDFGSAILDYDARHLLYTTYVYICMFILSGFAIKSLSYLPELWCHFVIACDPLVIHKKSHKTIYYDSWSAKYIKIERLTDTSCTGFNWVECQINKFPSSAQHIHFWLEHFIVIPIKKKENKFQFYVWKVRRVHSKYLLWAAHSKPKPLKATQRILDTMTDKDRQTDWQIGWYFVGGQNYFASTAAPQTVCVCVDSCTCWGIGHRHRHGHENMSRERERGERGRGERE